MNSTTDVGRTLVIVLAETRAAAVTFESFSANLVDVFDADVALCVTDAEAEGVDNGFYDIASYLWTLPEPTDWGTVIDDLQNQAGADHDWRRLLDVGDLWLGGVVADNAHPGSGAVLLAFRRFLKLQLVDSGALERYDRFIVTRSDFLHPSPHVPPELLPPGFVWIPDGEDYGGFTDRHVIADRETILDVLGIADDILLDPEGLARRMAHRDDWNLERVIELQFTHRGLTPRVRRYPYSMYTVRPEGTATRWSDGVYDEDLGYSVKYPNELRSARIVERILRGGEWTRWKMWVAGATIRVDRAVRRVIGKVRRLVGRRRT